MTVYDVVIAGAGPAGSALAIELASVGHTVALLDGARFPRDKVCGDFVSPRGLARLEALGCRLPPNVPSTPIRRSVVYLGRELLVEGGIPGRAGLPDHGRAIPRRDLDSLLFARAVAAGATSREECRVVGLDRSRSGVEVACEESGRRVRVRGRVLVGADGASSMVARLLGRTPNDARHSMASVRAYVRGLEIDHTLMYFDRSFFPGYGWVFPVRPGLCNVGVGMIKENIVRDGMRLLDFYEKFRRVVRKLGEAHGVTVEFERHRGWPIHTYDARRVNHFDRGLLIGEAGGFVDPINGEGIPLAFDTARIAAATLKSCFATGEFDECALAGFDHAWRSRLGPDLDVSDLVVSMIRNRDLVELWLVLLRATSCAAALDPSYAAVTGGILAGVVPAREALSLEMLARGAMQTPGVLRRLLGPGPLSWAGFASSAAAAVRWEANALRELANDPARSLGWLREVESKWRRVSLPGLARERPSAHPRR